ncbi:unnamed protein product [Brugia pahangi]|uniref:DNA-binding protein n=1 Tax=Brugia pahangi TaxID=6280 RepID=A0A0N4TG43_BRUPA|nr:unnamed protein product [Brugia pahangi]
MFESIIKGTEIPRSRIRELLGEGMTVVTKRKEKAKYANMVDDP